MGDLSVRLEASPGEAIGLAFVLDGEGSVRIFEPLVPMDLRATVDGTPVAVVQPPLDVGVQPRSVELPATVPCPVVLRFAAEDGTDDPFVWTLRHAPAAVQLVAVVEIDGAAVETAPVVVSPT